MNNSFNQYIQNLISEYKKLTRYGFELDINTLPNYEKKIILSHIVSTEDYEYALSNDMALHAIFLENESYLQSIVNNKLDEMYSDYMYQGGKRSHVDNINGETSWR